MANEGFMFLVNDVLEPFRRAINTEPPKEKLSASAKMNFNLSPKEGLTNSMFGSKKKSFQEEKDSSSSIKSVPFHKRWEIKKMKIDLIAAKAMITQLEARVKHQDTIRQEKQILFENEKESLMDQHKNDRKALKDMEDRIQVIKRRKQELLEEYNEAMKTITDNKKKSDKKQADLQKQIANLKDEMLVAKVSGEGQLSKMKKDLEELLQAFDFAQSEVDILKKEVAKQTSKAEQCVSIRIQLEKQTFELQQVTNKVKKLEYERDCSKDWQMLAKVHTMSC